MPRRLAVLVCMVAVACSSPDVSTERAGLDRAPSTTTGPSTTSSSTPTTTTSTTGPPAGADACPPPVDRRAPAADRPRYELELSADADSGVVTGSQRVRFVPDLAIDRLVLRLWANGPRPSSVGTVIEVRSLVVDGAPRPMVFDDPTTLSVALDRDVPAGTPVDVQLEWELRVGGAVNDRISRQQGSLRLGSFVPLLAWQPGVGWATEPPTSGFAEATTSTTADWRYRVQVPTGWSVVGSGQQSPDGTWVAEAARDIAVAVGRFTTVTATAMAPDPVAVTVSVHDGIDDPGRYLGQAVDHLEALARLYGPYPWPSYSLSITPSLSGGIEFPMHVMQGPGTDDRTTPHEIAHMWFYGLVGNNQALHPWLDEGLATYAEGRLEGTLGSMAQLTLPGDGTGRAGAPMTYWEGRSGSYYRSVYVQPAVALSRLPADLVDCALARFVAANAHTLATPDDLAAAFDAVFRDWRPALTPAGLP